MNRIAEFMGWEWGCSNIDVHDDSEKCWYCGWFVGVGTKEMRRARRRFNPYEDANDTELVEARLREKGLWEAYVNKLEQICNPRPPDAVWNPSKSMLSTMAATKEQRMQAALAVIP
jgi:hypothetical protein